MLDTCYRLSVIGYRIDEGHIGAVREMLKKVGRLHEVRIENMPANKYAETQFESEIAELLKKPDWSDLKSSRTLR